MLIYGKFDRIYLNGSEAVISFLTSAYYTKELAMDPEKTYKVEITEVKSKRSLLQNRYMWELINQIAKKQGEDEMKIYADIIHMANIKCTFLQGDRSAIDDLKRRYRLVIEREVRTSPKGVETVVVQCFPGTSSFDTKEMADFIDRLLDYAAQVGVDVSEYQGAWK